MTTTQTPNLQLTKAVPGTAEPFSTQTFNSNLDIIDDEVGDAGQAIADLAAAVSSAAPQYNDLVTSSIKNRNLGSTTGWTYNVLNMQLAPGFYMVRLGVRFSVGTSGRVGASISPSASETDTEEQGTVLQASSTEGANILNVTRVVRTTTQMSLYAHIYKSASTSTNVNVDFNAVPLNLF